MAQNIFVLFFDLKSTQRCECVKKCEFCKSECKKCVNWKSECKNAKMKVPSKCVYVLLCYWQNIMMRVSVWEGGGHRGLFTQYHAKIGPQIA